MTFAWHYLLLGLVFAWLPGRFLLNTRCSYLTFMQLHRRVFDRETRRRQGRRWWKLPLVWIDPVRGAVAAIYLQQAMSVGPDARGLVVHLPNLFIVVSLGIGLVLQGGGRRVQHEWVASLGFWGGMLLGLLPLEVAIPVLVLAVATMFAFHAWEAGFIVAGLAVAGLGYVFMGNKILMTGSVVLAMAPMLLSWLTHSKMVMPVRA